MMMPTDIVQIDQKHYKLIVCMCARVFFVFATSSSERTIHARYRLEFPHIQVLPPVNANLLARYRQHALKRDKSTTF